MRKTGFRVARSKTIAALRAGSEYVEYERRAVRESKNLLDTGEVSYEEVIALLQVCQGSPDQYSENGHHREPSIPVHIFKPVLGGTRWYIKVYFLDGTLELEPAIFISVHKSEETGT